MHIRNFIVSCIVIVILQLPKESIASPNKYCDRKCKTLNALLVSLADTSVIIHGIQKSPVTEHSLKAKADSIRSLRGTASQSQWQALFRNAWKPLSKARRNKVLAILQLAPDRKRPILNRIATLLPSILEHDVYFSSDDLRNALRLFPSAPTGVMWDGNEERYRYRNKKVHRYVLVIANQIVSNPTGFRSAFHRLNTGRQNIFRNNTRSDRRASTAEPFDLIKEAITVRNALVRSGFVNRVIISRLIHRSLYGLLGSQAKQDIVGSGYKDYLIHQDYQRADEAIILCAARDLNLSPRKPATREPVFKEGVISYTRLKLLKAITRYGGGGKFKCSGRSYYLKFVVQKATKLPLAAPVLVDNKQSKKGNRFFNVLIPFALVQETSNELVNNAVLYMGFKGYQLVSRRDSVDTLHRFKSEFMNAHMLIPVSHVLDVNLFHLGTGRSVELTFRKTIASNNGTTTTITARMLFPRNSKRRGSPSKDKVELTRKMLAVMLAQRRERTPLALFVFNASCRSTNTILTWTRAYRESLEMDIVKGKLESVAAAKDAIHAVGSKNSYPTAYLSDLLYTCSGLFGLAEMLAKGSRVQDALAVLRTPQTPDIFVLAAVAKESLSGRKYPFGTYAIETVYNHAMPRLLSAGRIDLVVNRDASSF